MRKNLSWLAAGALVLLCQAACAAPANRMILPDDVLPTAYRIAVTPHLAESTFDGRVEIDVDVRRRTNRIELDSADLVIAGASLDGAAAAPRMALDAKRQRASFTFAHALAPGRHVLRIAYSGRINDQAAGLFHLDHDTPQGPSRSLFTMFEDSDARRFVPSWDEPARRATFELTVTVPAALTAIGNMPVASTETLPGELKRVRFGRTPPMSTYLLFFGLGDFERVSRNIGGVDVGVVVKRGDTAQAAYALDAAAQLLPYYDDWFGTPYPLPKLDMVAGAGGSVTFGAMENWGAIFYFERDLLVDDRRASEDDRRRVFETVAHEIAHQWFGNLVTMAWWDDLWLNEGFASWMQVKAVEQLHPEWTGWAHDAGDKQRAMDIDARRGTHPVIMHIDDVSQAEGAFDTITYSKGAQVVRTLEAWQGDDTFRDGVRRYIARHAYGNTVTEDLWKSLDVGAPRPVTAIARDLTLQAGVPLVTELGSRCVDGHTVVALAQSQFSIDAPPVARWHVPVKVAVLGGGQARAVIEGASRQALDVPGCGPVIVNAGQATYARVRYSPAGLAALVPAFGRLGEDDQLGLLADTQALALAGKLPMGELLALMAGVPPSRDKPAVAQLLLTQLEDLDRLHDGLPAQPAFRAWARSVLAPFLAEAGWDGRADDSGDLRTLRVALIEALGEFGDPRVLGEVDKAFARYLAQPDSLDADHREAVLYVVATRADERTWEQLHGLALAAGSEVEKAEGYESLGHARDPALARRALTLAISGEPPTTVASRLLRAVARVHPGLSLDFIARHWARVEPLFGEGAGATIAARFFDTGADPALLPRLDAFVHAHVPPATRGRIVKNAAVIRYRATVRTQRLPEAGRWIAAHAPAS
ncbi:MAG: M1 family metallopeptidase [Vitreoscilla sp.]